MPKFSFKNRQSHRSCCARLRHNNPRKRYRRIGADIPRKHPLAPARAHAQALVRMLLQTPSRAPARVLARAPARLPARLPRECLIIQHVRVPNLYRNHSKRRLIDKALRHHSSSACTSACTGACTGACKTPARVPNYTTCARAKNVPEPFQTTVDGQNLAPPHLLA